MATVSRRTARFTAQLGLRSSGVLMTTQEFDDLPDFVFNRHLRYELINGILIVTPPPGNAEIDPNSELGHLVWYYQQYHPAGSVVDKVLAEQTVYATANRRRADHAIWTGLGRVPDVEKDIPSIVVELVSEKKRDHKRDYVEKKAEYLSIGVREYWIIDRFQRIMTVYLHRPDGVAKVVVPESGTYRTDLLPGFEWTLARLLARSDDWPKKKRNPPRKRREGDPR